VNKPSRARARVNAARVQFGQRRTADCVRDGVSILELGVRLNGKKTLVDEAPFGYALQ
jgi:hypothetical protein